MRSPVRTQRPLACIALGLVALMGAGCFPTLEPAFDSPAPAKRLDAIVDAAARDDRSTVPPLIDMLDSDDPAERMLAIRALERISGGQTFGYRYADPEWRRRESINRWVKWAESDTAGSPTGPETQSDPGRSPPGTESAASSAQMPAIHGDNSPRGVIAEADSEE